MLEEYYKADQEIKRLRNQRRKLRAKILRIMKKRGERKLILRGLRVLYVVRRKLPGYKVLKRFFGKRFWPVVARRRIVYDILKGEVERLIREGKIDGEAYKNILIPEDWLKVEKAKEY